MVSHRILRLAAGLLLVATVVQPFSQVGSVRRRQQCGKSPSRWALPARPSQPRPLQVATSTVLPRNDTVGAQPVGVKAVAAQTTSVAVLEPNVASRPELEQSEHQVHQPSPAASILGEAALPKVESGGHGEAAKPELLMERLKGSADTDPIGTFLFARWPKLRRIWTKADFLHAHAISGTIFIPGGTLWLLLRVVDDFMGGNAEGFLAADSSLAFLLTASGVINALTAIPMARFSSDKLMDLSDLKGNGFSLGGTGLTCMCAWMAWWFSGVYPGFLHSIDAALVVAFSLLCVATTANWEIMVQQNFEGDGAAQQVASVTAGLTAVTGVEEASSSSSGGGGGGGSRGGSSGTRTRQDRKFASALKEELKTMTVGAPDEDQEVTEAMAAAVAAKAAAPWQTPQ